MSSVATIFDFDGFIPSLEQLNKVNVHNCSFETSHRICCYASYLVTPNSWITQEQAEHARTVFLFFSSIMEEHQKARFSGLGLRVNLI